MLDGLVKTSFVASFWCELCLSIIAPVENTDYTPNNNDSSAKMNSHSLNLIVCFNSAVQTSQAENDFCQ